MSWPIFCRLKSRSLRFRFSACEPHLRPPSVPLPLSYEKSGCRKAAGFVNFAKAVTPDFGPRTEAPKIRASPPRQKIFTQVAMRVSPKVLDWAPGLCQNSGVIFWGRFCDHPAARRREKTDQETERRRRLLYGKCLQNCDPRFCAQK